MFERLIAECKLLLVKDVHKVFRRAVCPVVKEELMCWSETAKVCATPRGGARGSASRVHALASRCACHVSMLRMVMLRYTMLRFSW